MSTTTTTTPTRESRPSRLASLARAIHAWARQHPFRAIVVSGVAAILCGILFIGFGMMRGGGSKAPRVEIAEALAKLDRGKHAEARELAHAIQQEPALDFIAAGGPLFVLGVVAARDAESHINTKQQRKLYLVAARYLQESRDRGFPPGRAAEGQVTLGRCLFRSGHYAEALPVLKHALEGNPEFGTEIHGMLAHAYHLDSEPQRELALRHNQSYLEDRLLPEAKRHAALFHQALIQFEMGDAEASRATLKLLESATAFRSDVLIMEARLLMLEAERLVPTEGKSAARAKYNEAIQRLQEAQDLDGSNGGPTRRAQYLVGVCFRRMEDYPAAEAQFSRTRWLNFNTPEELASALEEAEIQHARGDHDMALSAYHRILHDAGDPRLYSNPWISLAELRARITRAYEKFRTDNRFEHAIQLAEHVWPILPETQSLELVATGYEEWGKRLMADAGQKPPIESEVLRITARTRFRRAAEAYSRLADLRFASSEHSNDLWLSGFNYLRGQNYGQAVKQISRYLETEPRNRRPRGLVALGEAQLAMREVDRALASLRECVEFHPKHPETYRARLLAAAAELENGRLPEAKGLLVENLQHEALTPQSLEWRDSLFYLGEILHLESVQLEVAALENGINSNDGTKLRAGLEHLEKAATAAEQAIEKLEEAVARYGEAPQATQARYMIAEAYRRAARLPRKKLGVVQVETTRSFLERQIKELLTNAEQRYDELTSRLSAQEEQAPLNPTERLIQRNSYFGRADALFDLTRYEEAIDAYQTASSRYQSEPESLEAFMQIASCYRRLNKPDDARGTIRQAQIVIRDRIPPDADFTRTTRYSRDQWQSLLNWLAPL